MRTLLFALLLGFAAPALAQAPAPQCAIKYEDAARFATELAADLKSPYCPGKTLQTCTSSQAYDLRGEIRDLFCAGHSRDEVVGMMQTRFGEDIANPPQPWYTFLIPYVPFIAGILLILWAVRRWRRGGPGAAAASAPAPVSPEDAERLARLRRQIASDPE
jgi:cytochrome c-type biogenesis protein CcmH/NrfF